jgi:TPR repeat protein
VCVSDGEGVEKDKKKEVYHLEEAAIAGHTFARHNLACYEGINGRHERAVKHWIINAKLGDQKSMEGLKEGYPNGLVSKEDFAAALRAYQAALDATKSPQRDKATEYEIARSISG